MWKRTSFSALPALGSLSLLLGACGNGQIGVGGPGTVNEDGYVELPDGTLVDPETQEVVTPNERGEPLPSNGATLPPVDPTEEVRDPEFPYAESLAAFQEFVYPTLQDNCSACHSTSGAGLRPLHSDSSVEQAHDEALGLVNLRQVATSRLVTRLAIDGHNCWSDCTTDSQVMSANVQAWADRLVLPEIWVEPPPEGFGEVDVNAAIEADQANFSATDRQYVKYASLHTLYEYGVTQDDLNVARAGLSKILNSVARYAPEIVNPVAVDGTYNLVYRFDIRDYWGYARGGNPYGGGGGEVRVDPEAALASWARIEQGVTRISNDDTEIERDTEGNALDPYINGFYPDADGDGVAGSYIEVSQLAYTLSRPDLYNELMHIPIIASQLENELGVDSSTEYLYMAVNDAITIGERLMWRTNIPDGYYWRSVDQFSTVDFVFYDRPIPAFTDANRSQIITTPVQQGDGGNGTPNEYTGDTGAQAQANEVIFSMPNGLQGYGIFGSGNQRRVDAFTFIVVDPRRGGAVDANGSFGFAFRQGEGSDWRLLNGASCMSCHVEGMNRAPDDMRPYIQANPDGAWTELANADGVVATQAEVERLFPGTAAMGSVIEADRNFFMAAMTKIQNEMIVGTTDKNLYVEPIVYLFETAQQLYGYKNTISN